MTLLWKRLIAAATLLLSAVTVANAFIPSRYTQNLQLSHKQGMYTSSPTAPAKNTRSSSIFSTSAPEDAAKKKNLTPETIAEMIEVSFINSCLQLASGYVDVLKLFIVAVKAGYEADLTLDSLEKLVEECPVNTANRELMKEEKDLRREWMLVVYEMLNGLKSDDGQAVQDTGSTGGASEERVSKVVKSILDVLNQLALEEEQSGGKQDAIAALASLSVSDAFSRSETLTRMNKDCNNDPMEKAFLMNDVSVGILTCKVLEEERVCIEGSSNMIEPPQPPIPGTS